MTHSEIIEKVKELVAAPNCNPDLRAKAEAYLKAQDKNSADALVKALETYVSSIDETLALADSDMGKKIFGAEQAANMVKIGRDLKAKGEKYCFCPACQAGSKIYESKEALA